MTGAGTKELTVRLANAAVSYARYLQKTVWPTDLTVCYPYPDHWPVPLVFGSIFLLALITTCVLLARRRAAYLLFGWLWFVGMLVPAIGLIQVGQQSMADRYTYLPSIGLWISFVWGAHSAFHYFSKALGAASCLVTREQAIFGR